MVNEIMENSLLSSHIQQVVLMYMYISILCKHDNEARFSLYPWDGVTSGSWFNHSILVNSVQIANPVIVKVDLTYYSMLVHVYFSSRLISKVSTCTCRRIYRYSQLTTVLL